MSDPLDKTGVVYGEKGTKVQRTNECCYIIEYDAKEANVLIESFQLVQGKSACMGLIIVAGVVEAVNWRRRSRRSQPACQSASVSVSAALTILSLVGGNRKN